MANEVSFKIAKLAKEMGYNDYSAVKYNGNGELVYHDSPTNIAAPTREELQAWLENEGLYISIAPEMYTTGINWNWQVLWYLPKHSWTWIDSEDEVGNPIRLPQNIATGTGYYGDNGEYPTRPEAMDAALEMSLLKSNILFRHNSIDKLAKLYNTDMNSMLDQIKPFSKELGEWSFIDLTMDQLNIIVSKIGQPPQDDNL